LSGCVYIQSVEFSFSKAETSNWVEQKVWGSCTWSFYWSKKVVQRASPRGLVKVTPVFILLRHSHVNLPLCVCARVSAGMHWAANLEPFQFISFWASIPVGVAQIWTKTQVQAQIQLNEKCINGSSWMDNWFWLIPFQVHKILCGLLLDRWMEWSFACVPILDLIGLWL